MISPRVLMVGIVAFGGGWIWSAQQGTVAEVDFLAVGQGDCTVFRSGDSTLLVDVGPTSDDFDTGKIILVPELRRMGVARIDLIVLTHPDLDHIGGLSAVMAAYPHTRVAVSSEFAQHPDLLARFKVANVPVERVVWLGEKGKVRLASWNFEYWCPPYDGFEDNAASIMMRASSPQISVTLTGDAPQETELAAVGQGIDWKAQILKAGHHGSAGSSSTTWLGAVSPNLVVLSCGRNNRYGHPARPTLDRIRAQGAKALRTDRQGTIRVVGQSVTTATTL